MIYFLGIVSILGFCDFVIKNSENILSFVDIDIIGRITIKPLVHFYDDFFIFVLLNSYYCSSKLLRL